MYMNIDEGYQGNLTFTKYTYFSFISF